MNDIEKLLREAFAEPQNAEPRRDLWPAMLRRMDERGARLGWFDWLLLGGSAVWLAMFPKTLVVLLYHL